MKLWILIPGKPAEQIEAANPVEKAREIIRNTMDFTKVVFKGKRCTMAVDDSGMIDGLPINHEATDAYRAHCIPGTVHCIHGPAVVFDGYLR